MCLCMCVCVCLSVCVWVSLFFRTYLLASVWIIFTGGHAQVDIFRLQFTIRYCRRTYRLWRHNLACAIVIRHKSLSDAEIKVCQLRKKLIGSDTVIRQCMIWSGARTSIRTCPAVPHLLHINTIQEHFHKKSDYIKTDSEEKRKSLSVYLLAFFSVCLSFYVTLAAHKPQPPRYNTIQ